MPNRNWKIATIALGIIIIGVVSYALYNFAFNKNTLNVKAAIIYKVGGAQPIARATFYLSKKDLETAAKNAGIKTSTSAASLWAFEESVNSQLGKKEISRFIQAFKPDIVSTATTDFNGDAKFESVPSGSYYLIGIAPTRSGMAVWNLPIKITQTQTIMLDQSNAIVAE